MLTNSFRKYEGVKAYHHSDEQDLLRTKPDRWNTPEVELRAEALLRPFTLKTWLDHVSDDPSVRPILVRLGILVIPDIDELYHETGIDLAHFTDFEVGQSRKYAGTPLPWSANSSML